MKARLGGIAALLWVLSILIGGTVQAVPPERGTVKIVDSVNPKPAPANDPHVCQFALEFMFGDTEAISWVIQSWPPTGNGSTVLSGTAVTDQNGSARQPVSGFYSLSNGHYKLSWDNLSTNGPARKHKVFWVQCTSTPTPTPTGCVDQTGQPSSDCTPTPTPITSPSVGPSATPTTTATPSGQPRSRTTPPPTDTSSNPEPSASVALNTGLQIGIVIGALIGGWLILRRLRESRR